jgi:hypothetical protein
MNGAARDKLRAYERIRGVAYHISTAVELKGDSYLVEASLIERLRECLRQFEHAQDVCNAHTLQKEEGGKFEDCLRKAKEVRRRRAGLTAGDSVLPKIVSTNR